MDLQLAQAIPSLELGFKTWLYYWLSQVPKAFTIRQYLVWLGSGEARIIGSTWESCKTF